MTNNAGKSDTINGRISEIRASFCNGNNVLFSQKIGVSKSRASNLCNSEPNIGKQVIEKILTAFPEVNRAWLILGEGSMTNEQATDVHEEKTPQAAPHINNKGDFNYNAIMAASSYNEVLALYKQMINDKDNTIADLRKRVDELTSWVHLVTDRYITVLDKIKDTTDDTNDIVREYHDKIGYKIGGDDE